MIHCVSDKGVCLSLVHVPGSYSMESIRNYTIHDEPYFVLQWLAGTMQVPIAWEITYSGSSSPA